MVTPKAMEDSAYLKSETPHGAETGTTSNTFTIDSDSATGKIIVDVALGAADLSLTLTNETLTSTSKIATLQNKTGTIALTSDLFTQTDADLLYLTENGESYSAKTTPVDGDYIIGFDSENSYAPIIFTYQTLKDELKKYFDTIYTPL
jgi:hypothetical protein